jgi:hypothetical protein
VGAGLALASSAANVAHGGSPVAAITDAANQLGPGPSGPGGPLAAALSVASGALGAAAHGGKPAASVGDAATQALAGVGGGVLAHALDLAPPPLQLPAAPLAALVKPS